MRIAVIGAGGVGGYFGARLAHGGHDVTFVARGRHLAAIREQGLTLESALGDITVRAAATDDPASVDPVDVAMVCVKLWDVEATAARLAPMLADGGVAIPFQNGVDAPAILSAALGSQRVLGGVAYIAANLRSPGVIAHTGKMARLQVGAFDAGPADKAAAFVEACRSAGVEAEHVPDIRRALWEKFVFLASMAGVTAMTRSPVGVVCADPDIRAVFSAAMDEVVAVGRAKGVTFADDFVARRLAFADGLPHEMRSSLLNDLVAGNRLEAPWLSGAVVRLAREAGLAAPVHATLYAAVKPFVAGHAS